MKQSAKAEKLQRRSRDVAVSAAASRKAARTRKLQAVARENHRVAPVERVEVWALSRLTAYANNPRVHSEEQIDFIAASMREFGQTQLIVVDESGDIIAGHGRLLAAQKLGWTHVAVGIAVGWSETQKKAYRIADNKIALGSSWDTALLKVEASALSLDGMDLKALGFNNQEWAKLLRAPISSPQLDNLSYAVIVRCDDENHQRQIIEQLTEMQLRVEALIS